MSIDGDGDVARVSAYIESGGKSSAMRFERSVYSRVQNGGTNGVVANIISINSCSRDTALVLYSMSFGAYQIMGFNLWGKDIGYTKTLADFISSPADQLDVYYKFLRSKNIDYSLNELKNEPEKLDLFALRYNGSTAYAAKVTDAIKKLGL